MKRAISLLLSLVLVLGCMTPVFAAQAATVSSTKTTLECGQSVGITVKMPTGLPKLVGIGLQITFDKTAFELDTTDADADDMYDLQPAGWFIDEDTGTANFMANNVTAGDDVNGKEYTFIFNSKTTAAADNYDFTVAFDADNTPDANYDPVAITGGTVSVNVTRPPVAATGVTLDEESIEIDIDEEETLVATVAPGDATNKAVTWNSSAPDKVSVDQNGKVTGLKVGTSTITVTTADGGFTDTCTVTVSCGAHEGGTATCESKKICTKCGAPYGELADHNYGELIAQADPIHTATQLEAGMKAHYECSVCHKLFDESKVEKQAADLTIAAPTHSFGAEWEYSATNHWHECACGAKSGDELHHGGTATCTALAVCADCGQTYGELAQHVYNLNVWVSDGSQHWHKCNSCDAKTDVADHTVDTNNDNKCDICDAVLCEHAATTPVDEVGATCTENGTQAHYKCNECGAKFKDAAATIPAGDLTIPAAHTLGEWNAEDPAECGVPGTKGHYVCSVCTKNIAEDKKTVIDDLTIPALVHTGGKADCQNKAICDLCEQPYGEIDPTNHVGGDMQYDANEHWGLCVCGEQINKEAHKGGTATCSAKAECSVCKQPYGEIDPTGHDWVDGVCSIDSKHIQIEKQPGTKVEQEIAGLPATTPAVKVVTETGLEDVLDVTKIFKEGKITVEEGKLSFELERTAPVGEYYIQIDDYVVSVVVAKDEDEPERGDRPTRPSATSDAVKDVIDMIDELPSAKKVTLDDEEDIEDARKAYEKLSKADKVKVTNYEALVEAEEALEALKTDDPEVIDNPFVDVDEDAYYADPVLWAVANNITSGTSAVTFSPDAVCTRAQVVTFLWRAAGCPAPLTTEMPFVDVEAGAYYAAAVQWAVENNITAGTSATTFDPNGKCTRGQIVTFLWRAQGNPAAAAVNNFVDVEDGAYYNAPVLWAVANGITNGTSTTTFSPAADCTRAQVVTFIYRCMAE